MDFRRFAVEVSTFSNGTLEAKERCGTHWQIWYNGKCLVDVWPTTNKYRESNLKSGAAAKKGDPYAAINRALEMFYLISKSPPLEIRHPAGSVKIELSQEYLKELAEKVEHGFNLLNDEGRQLFAHIGILIPKHKRCPRCNNDGTIKITIPGTTTFNVEVCPVCRGQRTSQSTPAAILDCDMRWWHDGKRTWTATVDGCDSEWKISILHDGTFYGEHRNERLSLYGPLKGGFKTLDDAKKWCLSQANEKLVDRTACGSPISF